jgi:hypothetical protein
MKYYKKEMIDPADFQWWQLFHKSLQSAKDGPFFSYINAFKGTRYKYKGIVVSEEYYFRQPENRKKLLIELIKDLK